MKSDVVIVFLSNNFITSHNCRREINFAIETEKELLVVYLEDLELTPGMRLQLNTLQAMFRNRCSDDDSFLESLSQAEILQVCLEPNSINNTSKEDDASESCTQTAKYKEFIEKNDNNRFIFENQNFKISQSNDNYMNNIPAQKVTGIVLNSIMQYQKEAIHKKELCKILYKDQLKPRQIRTAIRTFAKGINADDIVGMLDTTIFESGKEGFLFTDSAFYFSAFNKKYSISLKELQSASIHDKTDIIINFYNGTRIRAFIGFGYEEICDILNIIAGNFKNVSLMSDEIIDVALAARIINELEEKNGGSARFKFKYELTDKQISNALKEYAEGVNPNDVIAMFDTTIMNSGKEGWLLTKTSLYDSSKNHLSPIKFCELKSVEMTEYNCLVMEFKNGMIRKYNYSIYAKLFYEFLNKLLKNNFH